MNSEIMKVIKGEVTYDELRAIYHAMCENGFDKKGDHYHPDIFIDVCMKRIRGELSNEYFNTWLIVLCNLLNYDECHRDLSDTLDGMSFAERHDERNCREIISYIKDHDLRFKHPNVVDYHKRKKMNVVYLRFEFCNNEDSCIYKSYIIDHGKKTYDIRMIDELELDYGLSKNYCYIFDEEYEADIKRQEEDDDALCIDRSKPQKQFCEVEEKLINLIHDTYKRDRSLVL